MFDSATPVESGSDEWAERCRYWLDQLAAETPTRKRRERESRPLILTGHGVSMRVDKGCLLVKDGNTHYPAEKREWRLFKGGLDLPPRIVILDGSGNVTFDAIDWLGEQGIALVRVKYDGSIAAVMSPTGYAADLEKVAWQKATREDEHARLAFLVKTVTAKARTTLTTLETVVPASDLRDKALMHCQRYLQRLENEKFASKSKVLGVEASIARQYFQAWREVRIAWTKTTRYPIPDEWRSFTTRHSLNTVNGRMENQFATDPINAMLNYAYGMLLNRTIIQCVADGHDPTIGVIHGRRRRDEGKAPAFALDLMEPERPVVDAAVLGFIQERRFSGADFQLQSNGVCRLSPELARIIALSTSQLKLQPLTS